MKAQTIAITALLALLAPRLVLAQELYQDANNPSAVVGSVVIKCLNSAGAAVPISSGQCANGIAIVPGTLTPLAPNTNGAMTLSQAGVAQTLFTAGEVVHGCLVTNPLNAADEGIGTAEEVWVSVVGTATQAAGTSSIPIPPGSSFACGAGLATAVSWIAATQGHKISAYKD